MAMPERRNAARRAGWLWSCLVWCAVAGTRAAEPAAIDLFPGAEGTLCAWITGGGADASWTEDVRRRADVPWSAEAAADQPDAWRWVYANEGVVKLFAAPSEARRYTYAVTRPVGPRTPDGAMIVSADAPFTVWMGAGAGHDAQHQPAMGIYVAMLRCTLGDGAPPVWVRVEWPKDAAAVSLSAVVTRMQAATADNPRPRPEAIDGLRVRMPLNDAAREAIRARYATALQANIVPELLREDTDRVSWRLLLAKDGLPTEPPEIVQSASNWPVVRTDGDGWIDAPGYRDAWMRTLDYTRPVDESAATASFLARGAATLRVALYHDGARVADAEATVVDPIRIDARLAAADEAARAWREAACLRDAKRSLREKNGEEANPALIEALPALYAAGSMADEYAGVRLSVEQRALASRGYYARTPGAARYRVWAERLDAWDDFVARDAEARRKAADAGDKPKLTVKRPPPPARPGIYEGVYTSRIDGSVQPYRYCLPKAVADADRKIPLIVMLHGYVPDYNKESWVDLYASTARAMDELGAAFVWPFGRGNTDFLTIGEEDVLAVVTELMTRYPVDPDRIYLAGYSMGGSGVWTLLTHYPDWWAGAMIWSGRNDWFYWQSETLARAGLDRDNFPAFKKYLVLADNPYDMVENIAELPLYVTHPQDDYMVKPGQASRIFEKLKPPFGRMTLSQPARGGHFLFAAQIDRADTWRPLLAHARNPDPDAVELVTYTPKYGRKHWLQIAAVERWGEPARARVRRVTEDGVTTFHIDALENVRQFHLRWPNETRIRMGITFDVDMAHSDSNVNVADTGRDATWHWAQQPAAEPILRDPAIEPLSRVFRIRFADPVVDAAFDAAMVSVPDAGFVLKRRGAQASAKTALAKNLKAHALVGGGAYGPVKEAFNRRFVLVLGTAGTDAENEANRRNLDQFVRDWKTFAHADAAVVTDRAWLALSKLYTDTTEHRHAAAGHYGFGLAWNASTVCFGTPKTNAYLATLADRLPFAFYDDGYGVGDRSVRGEAGLGFVATYPRPDWPYIARPGAEPELNYLSPHEHPYVVVIDGTYYGARQSFNHKWDLAPDYLVFGPEQLAYDGNNAPRLAGFFDADWRVDPALAWTFPAPAAPEPAAADVAAGEDFWNE